MSQANGQDSDSFPALGGNTNGSRAATSSSGGLSAAQRLMQAHTSASASSSGPIEQDPFPVATEDPFPVAQASPSTTQARTTASTRPLDVSDQSAFPTLGGSTPSNNGSAATWGQGGQAIAARLKQQQQSSSNEPTPAAANGANFHSTTVQIPTADIHIQQPAKDAARNRNTFSNERQAEPTTLGEVIKFLAKRHPTVTVEASTSRQTTTFIIKARGAKAQDDVARVKRELLARLAKKTSVTVEVPAALRGFIVGAKGRTLHSIQDSTGAHIQLPARDDTESPAPEPATDGEDGALIPIVISGDSSAVAEAKSKILAIVAERVAKSQQNVDVPSEYWALLNGARGAKMAKLIEEAGVDKEKVNVFVPRKFEKRGVAADGADENEDGAREKEKSVSVSGDRDAVATIVSAIQNQVSELKRLTKTASVGVNKRQHRFLIGSAADDILEATGCAVEVPAVDDPNDNVTIRGTQADIIKAFGLVMEKANATPIDSLDLMTAHAGSHDRRQYASALSRFVVRRGKFRQLAEQHRVGVYLPRQSAIENGAPALIEIVGREGGDSDMAGARQAIIGIVRKLPPANFAVVNVDSLIHRHLIGKKGTKIKAFEEKRKVEVVFPPQAEEGGEDRSDIVLVFTGEGADAKTVLEEVKAEILNMAKEAADITTSTLSIPAQLHRSIIGQGGTTLNAVIGEEKLVNVSFGSKPRGAAASDAKSNGAEEDSVVIRGPSDEVARVRKALEEIAETAKNEEIVNSHVVEFEIDTIHVRHVVGKAGAGVTKLREELGVKVDFEQLGAGAADASAAGGKKKSAGSSAGKSRVTIKGRKENVEEARKRIRTRVTQIADEVTLSIPLPASLERGSLIGKQGTYLKRLEDKYEVRINFPRDGRKAGNDDDESPRPTAANSNPNEITVRGGKKGADAAKGELVALIAYEQENGNVVTFTVSTKALPRILGKGGASVNQIKEDTGVGSVDVDQESDDAPTSTITLRGTKSATKKAQEAILAIAKEVDNEARFTVSIPKEYHTTLIGSGGSNIRELIAKAGGPTDTRASGNTVRFPRQGDAVDDVVITAPKAVAEKIRTALEKEVSVLKSRVVYGVAIPQQQHASVIGKGASAIQELQRKHGVKVTMPSWNEYAQAGEIINPEDVKEAPAGDVVKIIGPKEAAIAAAADLAKGRSTKASATETVQVPRKYHAKIAQGGRFFRSLPSGTRVTHGDVKPPSSSVKTKKPPTSESASGASTPAPRIDDDEQAAAEGDSAVEFQLVPLYDDAEEQTGEDIPWIVQSSSQEDAEQVAGIIRKALERAEAATHVAWVTVPRGSMARIVGRGGSGLDALRSHGVEVEVVGKRDSNQLTLTGTPATIDAAHQQILRLAAPRPPRQQRNYDDEDRY